MNDTPSPNYFPAFPSSFIEQVHELVHIGYMDALARIIIDDKKANQEPSITGFIVTALTNRKKSFHPSPKWIMNYEFHDNSPEESDGRIGNQRVMPDIKIALNDVGFPEFFFEAKRLKKGSYTVGGYIGDDGIGCFIDGQYASRYDEAGMIGYVQSDSIEVWADKLKKKIVSELNLASPQQNVSIHPQINGEWISSHVRPNCDSREIKLYHILLDCTPEMLLSQAE